MFASSQLQKTFKVDEVHFHSAPNWSRPTKALLITGVALAALCFLVGSLPYIIPQGALPKALASLGTTCSTPFLIAGSSLLALALLPFIYKCIKHLRFKEQVSKSVKEFPSDDWEGQFDRFTRTVNRSELYVIICNIKTCYYRFEKRENKRSVEFFATPPKEISSDNCDHS